MKALGTDDSMRNNLTPADYAFAIAFGLALGALVGFGI